MRQRSIVKMILLSIITFGIYSLYWSISTKNEMNKLGANVPTAWLLIIPFVSIYWLWKYAEAVEQITGGKVSTPLAFVVEMLLNFIGDIIIQTEFNKLATAPAGGAPAAYGGPTDGGPLPDNTFGGPIPEAPVTAATPTPYAPTDPAAAAPAPVAAQPASFAPAPPQAPVEPTPPQPPTPTPPQVQ